MKTQWTLLLVQQTKPGHMTAETLFTTRDQNEVQELKQFLLEQDAGFRRAAKGVNAKPVEVIHVDPQEHQRWVEHPGRNGLKSRPVTVGQRFPSATAASGWLGLRHNELAMMLSRAAATGQHAATLRGVTFRYCSDEVSGSRSVETALVVGNK